MASRDYTDGFISNAASTSKSNGYLPKFEGGSANALTDHLTGRFEDYSLGVKKSLKSFKDRPVILTSRDWPRTWLGWFTAYLGNVLLTSGNRKETQKLNLFLNVLNRKSLTGWGSPIIGPSRLLLLIQETQKLSESLQYIVERNETFQYRSSVMKIRHKQISFSHCYKLSWVTSRDDHCIDFFEYKIGEKK